MNKEALVRNLWKIVSVDKELPDLAVIGRFPVPEGVRVDLGSGEFTTASPPGVGEPVTHFVRQTPEGIRFRTGIIAFNFAHDVSLQLANLQRCVKPDPTLGRPPRVAVTVNGMTAVGFLQVSNVTDFGRYAVTGFPRGQTFEARVVEAKPLDVELTSGTDAAAGETVFVRLGEGEIVEMLALRLLGDPLKGDLILRENPGLVDTETQGTLVRVLERDHPRMLEAVTQRSPVFGEGWQARVEALATSAPRGLPLDSQPDYEG